MFTRIACDPGILGGKPCIKGTRISVTFFLELFAGGATRAEILKAYPQLADDDIEQALRACRDGRGDPERRRRST